MWHVDADAHPRATFPVIGEKSIALNDQGRSFSIVSDQAQTVPWGEGYAGNIPRCSVTDPSEEDWTIEDEQCQKIGGGYKALKFRFLLFL
jgi:hypothetical protein